MRIETTDKTDAKILRANARADIINAAVKSSFIIFMVLVVLVSSTIRLNVGVCFASEARPLRASTAVSPAFLLLPLSRLGA